MSNLPNARDLLFKLLLADGAREVPGKKHRKWRLSNNFLFVTAKTPSDHRAWENCVRDLRRTMGEELFNKRIQEVVNESRPSKRVARVSEIGTWPEHMTPPPTLQPITSGFVCSPGEEPLQEEPVVTIPEPEPPEPPIVTVELEDPVLTSLKKKLEVLVKERDAELAKVSKYYDSKITSFEQVIKDLSRKHQVKPTRTTQPKPTKYGREYGSVSKRAREAIEKVIKPGEWFTSQELARLIEEPNGSATIRANVLAPMVKAGQLEAVGKNTGRKYRRLATL